MYYSTSGRTFVPGLTNLKGPTLNAWWFNPRDGKTYDGGGRVTDKPFGQFANTARKVDFDPPGEPGEGNDWVLVLDDAAAGYPPAGASRAAAGR